VAIISINVASTGVITETWSVPGGDILDNTLVPRGINTFEGTQAIPSLLSGNQSRIRITLSFDSPFSYLLKSLSVIITLDSGVTNDFEQVALLTIGQTGQNASFELENSGLVFNAANLLPSRAYRLPGQALTPKVWIDGSSNSCLLDFADISTDATVAGDIVWLVSFLIYDNEQRKHWKTNAPTPVHIF